MRPLLGLQFVFEAKKLSEAKSRKTPDSQPLAPQGGLSASRDFADGYSNDFSLQEAVLDGVSQLPGSEIPDWLIEVHIESIDAEFGGLTGLSRLKVSISSPQTANELSGPALRALLLRKLPRFSDALAHPAFRGTVRERNRSRRLVSTTVSALPAFAYFYVAPTT